MNIRIPTYLASRRHTSAQHTIILGFTRFIGPTECASLSLVQQMNCLYSQLQSETSNSLFNRDLAEKRSLTDINNIMEAMQQATYQDLKTLVSMARLKLSGNTKNACLLAIRSAIGPTALSPIEGPAPHIPDTQSQLEPLRSNLESDDDRDCIDVTHLGITLPSTTTRRGGTGSDGRRTNQTERSTQLFNRFERVAEFAADLRSTLVGHPDEVINFFVSMVTNVEDSLKGNTRIVTGSPGSGKSHIIQHVIRAVRGAGGKAEAFCETNVGASNIGGYTLCALTRTSPIDWDPYNRDHVIYNFLKDQPIGTKPLSIQDKLKYVTTFLISKISFFIQMLHSSCSC
jgi:hypothetical protein